MIRIMTILIALAVGLPIFAHAQAMPALTPRTSSRPSLIFTPRTFIGGIYLAGDVGNASGFLKASNPTCTLTVPTNAENVGNGAGPNGSLLLSGSKNCPGNFQLFLSNSGTAKDNTPLDATDGIGNNTGVYGGTFAIVDAPTDPTQQGQTVEWAGHFTQVFNIDPVGGACGALNFCANLGSAFGNETYNGIGLSYLLELDGFTWIIKK